MKKGEEVTGYVERVDFPNRGLVRAEDEATGEVARFRVANVIPGQTVKIRIQKKGKQTQTASVTEDGTTQTCSSKSGKAALISVEKRSDIEIDGCPCDMFGICGGCQYLTVPYEKQLQIKEDQIRRLLSPVIGEEEYTKVYEGIAQSPLYEGYRNKMELSFGNSRKDGPLTLGMHRRGSFYDVVDATDCRLMDLDMRDVAKITLEFFKNANVPFVHKRTGEGYLRHLLIRRGYRTGELLVDLVSAPLAKEPAPGEKALCTTMDKAQEDMLLNGWKDALMAWDHEKNQKDGEGAVRGSQNAGSVIAGILHTRCDRIADVIENQGTDVLYGEDFFSDRLLDLSFKITPFSFFQTNTYGAEILYKIAGAYIMGSATGEKYGLKTTVVNDEAAGSKGKLSDKTVYDLYSGTGTIAQIISDAAKQVIGVEIVEEAVEAAKENAARNGIANCSFIAGDVLKVLDVIDQKPDMLILDPPRDGVHPKALPKLIAYDVDEILYISCKATSLARDLPFFMESGYVIKRLCCVDLFPNTTGVETVVLMGKTVTRSKSHVDLGLDVEDYFRVKDSEKKQDE